MQMRILLAAVTLSMTAALAHAQQLSLVGTWTGDRERMAKDGGYRSGPATLVITEQQGRAFKGYLNRSNKDGDVKEDLWGAFTPNGHLMVGSDEEGFYWFTLVNVDTLDYCYSEAGKSARTTCARLIRQKK
jgi:hypothetical protein